MIIKFKNLIKIKKEYELKNFNFLPYVSIFWNNDKEYKVLAFGWLIFCVIIQNKNIGKVNVARDIKEND